MADKGLGRVRYILEKNRATKKKWAITRDLNTKATKSESLGETHTECPKRMVMALDAQTVADWVIPWKSTRRTVWCLLTAHLYEPANI